MTSFIITLFAFVLIMDVIMLGCWVLERRIAVIDRQARMRHEYQTEACARAAAGRITPIYTKRAYRRAV